ncbi:MAG: hypothetical protein COT85_02585 [Chlamydiae bacterium CG10_big_fil_rev_8_21_14_0_10_42_34]|nr:MAG: hypothetical protein COT85_02585 [Chlamydiae bacterium CG10_big_fil_rev_8_21_14_0_10_42_34]
MNFLILLYLLAIAPKLLWEKVRKGKSHPAFFQRLGLKVPTPTKNFTIWIHAVSVGEIKSASSLYTQLRKSYPDAFFLITTTTATGQMEAKRSLPQADAYAYLPIDLTWVVRRWVKKLNPKLFILIETDFWPQLLTELKRNKTKVVLVSGKLSERSAKRFFYFKHFAKKLFSNFDLLCVQSEEHFKRFFPLVPDPKKLHTTGNLKLDLEAQKTAKLQFPQPAITISCTHETEEEQLLDALLDTDYFLILAPRHPERFEKVAGLLKQKNIPFSRFTSSEPYKKVLLVDCMGKLPICYANSRLAIVAGSYVKHIGGHNVLEPCLYGTPVIFGPHIFGQKELANRAQSFGAAKQVSLHSLKNTIESILSNVELEKSMRAGAKRVVESGRGSTAQVLKLVRAL